MRAKSVDDEGLDAGKLWTRVAELRDRYSLSVTPRPPYSSAILLLILCA